MGIEMTINGALARASRFERAHLGGAVDTWLIQAFNPVTVVDESRQAMLMRTQFALTTVRLDDLPNGGYPRREAATHMMALGVLAREFDLRNLADGAMPVIGPGRLLACEFEAGDDAGARAVGRAIAAGFTTGEVPLQGRYVGLMFIRCVRIVALTVRQSHAAVTSEHPPVEMTSAD
jgi:hypothetical protein